MKNVRENQSEKERQINKEKDQEREKNVKSEKKSEFQRLEKFRDAVRYGPIFVCCCCDQKMFRNNAFKFEKKHAR
jgi:peptide methionine sulfoxide reductase MsrB